MINKLKTVFVILVFFILFTLSGCTSSTPQLERFMLEKYEDDQNYVALSGEIVEHDDDRVIIRCEELKEYIDYATDTCDYYIYSTQPIELTNGDTIDFITVPFHFYNGQHLPIVQVTINGTELLSFDEGKINLINWVINHLKF